jgi:hypothetical protein
MRKTMTQVEFARRFAVSRKTINVWRDRKFERFTKTISVSRFLILPRKFRLHFGCFRKRSDGGVSSLAPGRVGLR